MEIGKVAPLHARAVMYLPYLLSTAAQSRPINASTMIIKRISPIPPLG
jgi:hypothetical protein